MKFSKFNQKQKSRFLLKTFSKKKSSSNMTLITGIHDFVIIFQNIEMIDTFVKTLNNRIINQLKTKFAIIDVEKRRVYLQQLLT